MHNARMATHQQPPLPAEPPPPEPEEEPVEEVMAQADESGNKRDESPVKEPEVAKRRSAPGSAQPKTGAMWSQVH